MAGAGTPSRDGAKTVRAKCRYGAREARRARASGHFGFDNEIRRPDMGCAGSKAEPIIQDLDPPISPRAAELESTRAALASKESAHAEALQDGEVLRSCLSKKDDELERLQTALANSEAANRELRAALAKSAAVGKQLREDVSHRNKVIDGLRAEVEDYQIEGQKLRNALAKEVQVRAEALLVALQERAEAEAVAAAAAEGDGWLAELFKSLQLATAKREREAQDRLAAEAEVEAERAERVVSFDFVDAAFLLGCEAGSLPSCAQLRAVEGAIVRRTLRVADAYRGAYASDLLAVSHVWEHADEPDRAGAQMRAVKAHLREHPEVRGVWYDFSCCQLGDEASPADKVRYEWMRVSAPLLFLGCRVLLLVDASYAGRFWCQLEAWLSWQEGSSLGLRSAPGVRRRAELVCLHDAKDGKHDVQLRRSWERMSAEAACAALARPDALVTHAAEKSAPLSFAQRLNEEVREAWSAKGAAELRKAGRAAEALPVGFSDAALREAGYSATELLARHLRLLSDADDAVRYQAAEAIGDLEARQRATSMKALGLCPSGFTTYVLAAAVHLGDADEGVREAALETLGKLEPEVRPRRRAPVAVGSSLPRERLPERGSPRETGRIRALAQPHRPAHARSSRPCAPLPSLAHALPRRCSRSTCAPSSPSWTTLIGACARQRWRPSGSSLPRASHGTRTPSSIASATRWSGYALRRWTRSASWRLPRSRRTRLPASRPSRMPTGGCARRPSPRCASSASHSSPSTRGPSSPSSTTRSATCASPRSRRSPRLSPPRSTPMPRASSVASSAREPTCAERRSSSSAVSSRRRSRRTWARSLPSSTMPTGACGTRRCRL